MRIHRVLFVGGNVQRLASVKIRCRDIADRLGCNAIYGAETTAEIPDGYDAYFCVKPRLSNEEVERLSRRAPVLWDVLDDVPPTAGITTYVFSTQSARNFFPGLKNAVVIPHHHCNFDRFRPVGLRTDVAYIGSAHWYPKLNHIPHKTYFIEEWTREQVVEAYCRIGIALNMRTESLKKGAHPIPPGCYEPEVNRHVGLNSGLKLINCLGFGLPSVSSLEPAYQELAHDCTLFSNLMDYASGIRRIWDEPKLYDELRERCFARAERFHIDNIVLEYKRLLSTV